MFFKNLLSEISLRTKVFFILFLFILVFSIYTATIKFLLLGIGIGTLLGFLSVLRFYFASLSFSFKLALTSCLSTFYQMFNYIDKMGVSGYVLAVIGIVSAYSLIELKHKNKKIQMELEEILTLKR